MKYTNAILLIIEANPGISKGNLALKLMGMFGPNEFDDEQFEFIIKVLINRKHIKRIRYKIDEYVSEIYFLTYTEIFFDEETDN